METWFPFIISVPNVVLAAVLLWRIRIDPSVSFIFLSFRTEDTSYAVRLFLIGFLSQIMLRLYDIMDGQHIVEASIIVGTFTTIAIFFALVLLNIIVRGPTHRLYPYLPSFWLTPAVEHVVGRIWEELLKKVPSIGR